MPNMASLRIQRWAVSPSVYEYGIIYKPGTHHGNADAMSQRHLQQPSAKKEHQKRVLMMENVPRVSR